MAENSYLFPEDTIAFADDRNQWFEAIREAQDPLLYSRKQFVYSSAKVLQDVDYLPNQLVQEKEPSNFSAFRLHQKLTHMHHQKRQEEIQANTQERFLRGLLGE